MGWATTPDFLIQQQELNVAGNNRLVESSASTATQNTLDASSIL